MWGGTPRACRRRSLVGDKDCGAATVFLWLNRDVAGASKLPARLAFKFPGGRLHHHGTITVSTNPARHFENLCRDQEETATDKVQHFVYPTQFLQA